MYNFWFKNILSESNFFLSCFTQSPKNAHSKFHWVGPSEWKSLLTVKSTQGRTNMLLWRLFSSRSIFLSQRLSWAASSKNRQRLRRLLPQTPTHVWSTETEHNTISYLFKYTLLPYEVVQFCFSLQQTTQHSAVRSKAEFTLWYQLSPHCCCCCSCVIFR